MHVIIFMSIYDEGVNLTHFGQSQPLVKSQSCDGQTRISKSTFQGDTFNWIKLIKFSPIGLSTSILVSKVVMSSDGRPCVIIRRCLTCRFRASLKHKDDGQTKFIKPNSQRQDIIIKYWVSIWLIHKEQR